MSTPVGWVETAALLKKSGTVTLDANGQGVINFDPDSARQRWEVSGVVGTTDQSATATVVPFVTLALNTVTLGTMSPGNQRGTSWNGNQFSFSGRMDVGPCDFMSVIFAPPTGTSGASLAGVHASVVITGTKYTRRS